MVAVALIVGVGLNSLDKQYQVKERVLKALDTLPTDIEQGVYTLNQHTLLVLEQAKAEWQRKGKELQNKAVNTAADAAATAAELALQAALSKAKEAIRQFFRPGRTR
jgi:hypothetical protein